MRARVGQKHSKRVALGTDFYDIARALAAVKLREMRAMVPAKPGEAPVTLWDALKAILTQKQADPKLKVRSKGAYADVIHSLRPGVASGAPTTPLPRLSREECEAWWARTAALYRPARANYQLLFFRQAIAYARDMGCISKDVTKNLHRVHVPRTKLTLITKDQFADLVAAIRAIPRNGGDAGDWVEFVSYCGPRPEEAYAVQWEHIDRVAGVLVITGDATGTKNRKIREVPLMPALVELLDRIAARTGRTTGRVLNVRNPRLVIRQGCAAIGIPDLRRKDFRHLFATRCAESGIDAPTISGWMGHQDGGALVMKTYIHIHSAHSRQSAAKVRF